MRIAKYGRATLATVALAALAVGCGDDTVLGAPDVAACTAGTLSAGDTKSGAIDASSCRMWHDYYYGRYLSESWTIHAKANTAYIARLIPKADAEGVNTFNGELAVFGRNGAGDAGFATGYWGSFGTPNTSGGYSVELIFTTTEATTVSLRAFAWADVYTGSYDIELIACPVQKIAVGAPATAQEFDAEGCGLLSDGLQSPAATPVRFWSFDGNAGTSYTTTFTRVAGTSVFRGRQRGPNLDFGCYTGSCIANSTGTGIGPSTIVRTPLVTGSYTVAVLQQTAGTLTASVGVARTPSLHAAISSDQR